MHWALLGHRSCSSALWRLWCRQGGTTWAGTRILEGNELQWGPSRCWPEIPRKISWATIPAAQAGTWRWGVRQPTAFPSLLLGRRQRLCQRPFHKLKKDILQLFIFIFIIFLKRSLKFSGHVWKEAGCYGNTLLLQCPKFWNCELLLRSCWIHVKESFKKCQSFSHLHKKPCHVFKVERKEMIEWKSEGVRERGRVGLNQKLIGFPSFVVIEFCHSSHQACTEAKYHSNPSARRIAPHRQPVCSTFLNTCTTPLLLPPTSHLILCSCSPPFASTGTYNHLKWRVGWHAWDIRQPMNWNRSKGLCLSPRVSLTTVCLSTPPELPDLTGQEVTFTSKKVWMCRSQMPGMSWAAKV